MAPAFGAALLFEAVGAKLAGGGGEAGVVFATGRGSAAAVPTPAPGGAGVVFAAARIRASASNQNF